MIRRALDIVVLGLSVTSSWGNGHATTWRALLRAFRDRGHRVTFLERDVPWYADNRDLPEPAFCTLGLYHGLDELMREHGRRIREADAVIVGSYVPDGVAVLDRVLETAGGLVAFYDIDTPVTLARLTRGDHEYLAPRQIPALDLYLSFTGGPTLEHLERELGARRARALYCSADPHAYYPEPGTPQCWDLGYLGTWSEDRQPAVERLLNAPARALPGARFVVAGPQYPQSIAWPTNVERIEHLSPPEHRDFYNACRFTLNVTRADMIRAGWSPSVRLFEAAACGTPIISDPWPGLDSLFRPGREILIAANAEDVIGRVSGMTDEARAAIGEAARTRVMAEHTAEHRAAELETYLAEAADGRRPAAGEI